MNIRKIYAEPAVEKNLQKANFIKEKYRDTDFIRGEIFWCC